MGIFVLELMVGIEPTTFSLRVRCSAIEPHQPIHVRGGETAGPQAIWYHTIRSPFRQPRFSRFSVSGHPCPIVCPKIRPGGSPERSSAGPRAGPVGPRPRNYISYYRRKSCVFLWTICRSPIRPPGNGGLRPDAPFARRRGPVRSSLRSRDLRSAAWPGR